MKPEVVISPPKNFDRSKYVVPQLRKENEENDSAPTSKKSKEKETIEEQTSEKEDPQERHFDRVEPIERIFQPRDFALPRKPEEDQGNKGQGSRNISEKVEDIRRAIRPKSEKLSLNDDDWKVVKQKAVEEIADKILRQEVEISTSHAIKASPELQKALLRKLRNRRLPRRDAKSFFEAEIDEKLVKQFSNFGTESEFVDLDELEVDQTFEVLEEARGQLEAGSIVQKDPVEQYIRDLPMEQQRNVFIVANVMDGLRCIYPEVNGSKERVETIIDSGSQIVAVDMVVAIGLGMIWDPDTNVVMQSANGQLQRTKGLARNVPFTFGEVEVFLQLHVVEDAPYQILLGRPFDVLTNSEVQNFPDGDQLIVITCPNTRVKCTIPTYPRGEGIKIRHKTKKPILRRENARARQARKEREDELKREENSEIENFQ